MAKKLIALLLAVLMLAGMLAGCAKTAETPAPAAEDPADTSDSSSTTDTPAPSSDAEPIEISIAYEESTHPVDTDTFAACKKLEETLGIKINWLNWGGEEATYKEKLNLAMASGTAPDLFMIPASYFTTEEEAEKSDIMTALSEYCNAQIQDFIEGTRPLTEEEYAKFQDECLNEYGAARWCEIMNTAYAAWKG